MSGMQLILIDCFTSSWWLVL